MSSETSEAEAKVPKKKGKGMMMKLIAGIALLGAGGGGAFGAMQAGLIGGGDHAEKQDNNPKLVKKGEEDPYAPASKDKDAGGEVIYGDGGSEYRTLYFTFTDDFISNLRNSNALIQVSLAASTRRDGRVVMWMSKHELAIRSAMLTVLADTPETDIYTPEGKEQLQTRLTGAINKVLTDREGFGGVDSVYFKTFIIQ